MQYWHWAHHPIGVRCQSDRQSSCQSTHSHQRFDSQKMSSHHFPIDDERGKRVTSHANPQAHKCGKFYSSYSHPPLGHTAFRPCHANIEIHSCSHCAPQPMCESWRRCAHCAWRIAHRSHRLHPAIFVHRSNTTRRCTLCAYKQDNHPCHPLARV